MPVVTSGWTLGCCHVFQPQWPHNAYGSCQYHNCKPDFLVTQQACLNLAVDTSKIQNQPDFDFPIRSDGYIQGKDTVTEWLRWWTRIPLGSAARVQILSVSFFSGVSAQLLQCSAFYYGVHSILIALRNLLWVATLGWLSCFQTRSKFWAYGIHVCFLAPW